MSRDWESRQQQRDRPWRQLVGSSLRDLPSLTGNLPFPAHPEFDEIFETFGADYLLREEEEGARIHLV